MLFVTRGSSGCPSLASKMKRPRKTRSLTGFGPDARCRAEFEGITLLPAHLLTLIFLYSLLLKKSAEEQAFLLFPSHCQAFLKFISLDIDPIFPTLAIITHLIPAFPFFSLAGLFRSAVFLCAKMNFTLFIIVPSATCSCRNRHLVPLSFLGDKGKSCSSTKHSPRNVHGRLRALDQCEAHFFSFFP